MQIDVLDRRFDLAIPAAAAPLLEDPLDHDGVDDPKVVTTRRGLVRLALVAAETASRFARENVEHDPVAWLLAPRRLFEGRSAIDACLNRTECLRTVLLHGLSMGLDADPEEFDWLIRDDGESWDDFAERAEHHDGGRRPRLWTSFLVGAGEDGTVQAFDAVVAEERSEAEARLRARHGAALADGLEIVEGFDATLPLAEALVSPALADMLEQVAQDPASPLAKGLSISVQQRFAA